MRPLLYGYVRSDLAEWDGQVGEWDSAIGEFADAASFDLGRVFHDDAGRGGFRSMLAELGRSGSRHVVVPRMGHIYCAGPFPQRLVARLWDECGAGVWIADVEANRIEVKRAGRGKLRGLDGAL